MRLVVATKNRNKLREFRQILGEGFEVVGMDELGIDAEIVEDADTFEGNALKKATEIARLCGFTTVADDSGICVEALSGAPGVYSARYSGEGATDLSNNLKLLREMEGQENRNAKFVCAIAVVFPDGTNKILKGELHGVIDFEMKGENGFGYDVLFYLPEYKMTTAQLPPDLKNKISHRAKALGLLKEFLSHTGK
ncbi:MAG: Non-canonical purine NTP pyrophosphatase [Firmicutes bacterium ADurb.Bin193]|nr:MAG: Non-canonical purine NTP pyrophosphatase [Firmicutes bacterium ADurb.Bin193]